jgi:hypothetical protein
VNFKDETNINGDLRSESQKTQAERLKPQNEYGDHKPRTKVISRYMRRSSAGPRIWVAPYSQVSVPFLSPLTLMSIDFVTDRKLHLFKLNFYSSFIFSLKVKYA